MDALETGRFQLRPLRKSDMPPLVRKINNRKIYRALKEIPYPYRERDGDEFLAEARREARRKRPGSFFLAIVVDGEAAGCIGFESIEGHKAELGYWLGEEHWGQGIMTQAVRLFTRYGMDRFGLRRVYAHVFPYNRASMRVLEKAGYRKEGVLRKDFEKDGRYSDYHLYARVR